MTLIILIILIVVAVVVVAVVALALPGRPASGNRVTPHSELDAESEAFRDHQPGGGTGSI